MIAAIFPHVIRAIASSAARAATSRASSAAARAAFRAATAARATPKPRYGATSRFTTAQDLLREKLREHAEDAAYIAYHAYAVERLRRAQARSGQPQDAKSTSLAKMRADQASSHSQEVTERLVEMLLLPRLNPRLAHLYRLQRKVGTALSAAESLNPTGPNLYQLDNTTESSTRTTR